MYSKKVNWAMHIRKQAQSAQTIVKYCSENNLNIHSFQYQRRKKSTKLVSNFVPAEIVSDMPIKDGLSIKLDEDGQFHVWGSLPLMMEAIMAIRGRG